MYRYDFNLLIWVTLSTSSIQIKFNENNSHFVLQSKSMADYKKAVVTYERQLLITYSCP